MPLRGGVRPRRPDRSLDSPHAVAGEYIVERCREFAVAVADHTRRLGLARLESAVRREVTRSGGQKPCLRIVRRVFSALSDPAEVTGHRPGALDECTC
jgi:hypothetical protein